MRDGSEPAGGDGQRTAGSARGRAVSARAGRKALRERFGAERALAALDGLKVQGEAQFVLGSRDVRPPGRGVRQDRGGVGFEIGSSPESVAKALPFRFPAGRALLGLLKPLLLLDFGLEPSRDTGVDDWLMGGICGRRRCLVPAVAGEGRAQDERQEEDGDQDDAGLWWPGLRAARPRAGS